MGSPAGVSKDGGALVGGVAQRIPGHDCYEYEPGFALDEGPIRTQATTRKHEDFTSRV